MRIRRSRLLAAAAAATGAAVLLSGCSLHLRERGWASDLREEPGDASSDWSYRNNWPSSGPHSTGELVLDPGLTIEQARGIAERSCASTSDPLDQVDVDLTASDGSWTLRAYDIGDSCFDPERLVAFAEIARTAGDEDAPFSGSLELGFTDPDEPAIEAGRPNPELRFSADADDAEMLAPLLGRVRPALAGFVSEVVLTNDELAPQSSITDIVSLRLARDEAPSALPGLLGLALEQRFAGVRYEDGTLTVSIVDTDALPAARARLAEAAAGGDVRVDVRLPRMTQDGDPEAEERLAEAVLAQPQVQRIEFVTGADPGPVVRVSGTRDLDALVRLLAEQGPGGAPFRIVGPQEPPRLEFAAFGGALSSDDALHVYAVADGLTEAPGVELVMVRLNDGDRTLLRVDIAESASTDERQAVRDRVRALVGDPALSRIIVADPDSDELTDEYTDDGTAAGSGGR